MKIQTIIFRNILSRYNENDSAHVAASEEFTKSTFHLFCGLLYDLSASGLFSVEWLDDCE
jgi:hypothetical protein